MTTATTPAALANINLDKITFEQITKLMNLVEARLDNLNRAMRNFDPAGETDSVWGSMIEQQADLQEQWDFLKPKRDAMKSAMIADKMKAAIAGQSTEFLKDVAVKLMDIHDEGSSVVFTLTLNELETRMPEDEFVAFCDSL